MPWSWEGGEGVLGVPPVCCRGLLQCGLLLCVAMGYSSAGYSSVGCPGFLLCVAVGYSSVGYSSVCCPGLLLCVAVGYSSAGYSSVCCPGLLQCGLLLCVALGSSCAGYSCVLPWVTPVRVTPVCCPGLLQCGLLLCVALGYSSVGYSSVGCPGLLQRGLPWVTGRADHRDSEAWQWRVSRVVRPVGIQSHVFVLAGAPAFQSYGRLSLVHDAWRTRRRQQRGMVTVLSSSLDAEPGGGGAQIWRII